MPCDLERCECIIPRTHLWCEHWVEPPKPLDEVHPARQHSEAQDVVRALTDAVDLDALGLLDRRGWEKV